MNRKIAELKTSPKNKEIYSMSHVEDLTESMAEMGLLTPIVITPKGEVVSGNGRLAAAKKLGWQEIDVVVMDVEDDDIVKHIIHFNKQRHKTVQESFNEIEALKLIYKTEIAQGKRKDNHSEFFGISEAQSNRNEIAKSTGLAVSRIMRIEKIAEVGRPLLELIDAGQISLEKAYKKCVRAEKGNRSPMDKPLSREKNGKEPISVTCPKCDHEWKLKP
jgi:ParB-like chromosome segregation protein Spo0J